MLNVIVIGNKDDYENFNSNGLILTTVDHYQQYSSTKSTSKSTSVENCCFIMDHIHLINRYSQYELLINRLLYLTQNQVNTRLIYFSWIIANHVTVSKWLHITSKQMYIFNNHQNEYILQSISSNSIIKHIFMKILSIYNDLKVKKNFPPKKKKKKKFFNLFII